MGMVFDGKPWVGTLGVRKPWRGRGIGEALLRRSFLEFHRRGHDHVALGVDAANETGATALYERVGMHVTHQFDEYEKRLR
jgi:mycothiol synthase